MAKYQAIYKCQVCGYIHTYGDPFEADPSTMPDLFSQIMQNQLFKYRPELYKAPMHMVCHCVDGSFGFAVLAGFRKV